MKPNDYRARCHECRRVMDSFTEWEKSFLRLIQRQEEFTSKQKAYIDRLYERISEPLPGVPMKCIRCRNEVEVEREGFIFCPNCDIPF